jgi:hypothetical protein
LVAPNGNTYHLKPAGGTGCSSYSGVHTRLRVWPRPLAESGSFA